MAGVAVEFAVATGGGNVEGGAATTNASGIARVTRWTLGLNGTQQLTARVAALPVVTFTASVTPGTAAVTFDPGPTGGTLVITEDGHPYEGLTLIVPSGSAVGTGGWRFRVLPNAQGPALPTGYERAGPILEVTTEMERTTSLMTLEVPVPRRTGANVVIVYHDPVRRVSEVMPTIGRTDSSVRVLTSHLRADLLLGRATPAAATFRLGRFLTIGHLLPVSQLLPVLPSNAPFNSATNRWPVTDYGSAPFPNGHGAAIPALELASLANSLKAASTLFSSTSRPGFYPEVAPLAAVVQTSNLIQTEATGTVAGMFGRLALLSKAVRDELVDHNIVAGIALSTLPVLTARFSASGSTVGQTVFDLSIGGTDNTVLRHAAPLTATEIVRQATGRLPVSIATTPDGTPFSADEAVPLTSFTTAFEKVKGVLIDLEQALAATGATRRQLGAAMGSVAGLATGLVELEAVTGRGFKPLGNNPAVIRSGNERLRVTIAGFGGSSVRIDLLEALGGGSIAQLNANTFGPPDIAGFGQLPLGATRELSISPYTTTAGNLRQINVEPLELRKSTFGIVQDTVHLQSGQIRITLDVEVPDPPAGGYQVRWAWGDGMSTTTLNALSATYIYQQSESRQVIATLLDASATELAADTSYVVAGAPYWHVMSMVDVDNLLDVNDVSPLGTLLQRMIANPAAAMLAFEPTGIAGNTHLIFRVLPAFHWTDQNCCTTTQEPNEMRLVLGVSPSTSNSVGPAFSPWNTNSWSQSVNDLDSGTMSGQSIEGLTTYVIPNAGTQVGPTAGFRTMVTRSGRRIDGTLTITAWGFDLDTGEGAEPSEYRFNFSAFRFR